MSALGQEARCGNLLLNQVWLWFMFWLGFIPGAAQQLPVALVEGADPEELNPPPGRRCRGSEQAHIPDLSHFPLLLQWCVLCSVTRAELAKQLEKGFSWNLQQQLWGSQSSPSPSPRCSPFPKQSSPVAAQCPCPPGALAVPQLPPHPRGGTGMDPAWPQGRIYSLGSVGQRREGSAQLLCSAMATTQQKQGLMPKHEAPLSGRD